MANKKINQQQMNKVILSTLIIGLIFIACHSTKMAQRAVSSQPVVTQSPAEK